MPNLLLCANHLIPSLRLLAAHSDAADAAAEGEHAVSAGCVADALPAAQGSGSSG